MWGLYVMEHGEKAAKKKFEEVQRHIQAEELAKTSKAEPFPKEVRLWSVTDVGRWLDTLTLSQYVQAFKEASVDGDFLLELREEDLAQVRGHHCTSFEHQTKRFASTVSIDY